MPILTGSNTIGTLVAVIASAAFSFSALAQPAAGPGIGAMPSKLAVATTATDDPASTKEVLRVKKLHDGLRITPAQEPLWADVAAVMQKNDTKLAAMSAERHHNSANLTAVQDLESYSEITEAHGAAIKSFSATFSKLYSAMPPDQQKLADHMFRGDAMHSKKAM